jgi:hypothetical protein
MTYRKTGRLERSRPSHRERERHRHWVTVKRLARPTMPSLSRAGRAIQLA